MKFLFILSILSACVFLTFAGANDDEALQKEVDDWLKRVHEFGEEWTKNTQDQPQFSEEWKKAVEEKLDEIREIAQVLLAKKKNNEKLTQKEQNTWRDKLKAKFESIRKFGTRWAKKIAKKFREVFLKDWQKTVEDKIDELIDELFAKLDRTFRDKIKDMWNNIKNFGKLDKLKLTKFPLPLDLEGVKIKYHKSKICVNQKGDEKCASKKDEPGHKEDVEKLFRVIHEYQKLQQNQHGGGGDDGGGDGGDGGGGNGGGGDDHGDDGGDYIDNYKKDETLNDDKDKAEEK